MSGSDSMTEDELNQVIIDQLMAEEMHDHQYIETEDDLTTITPANVLIDHLWHMANEHIQPLIVSRCKIDLHAQLSGKEIDFQIDTGASSNVMTSHMAKQLGLESYIDTKYKGVSRGVGTAAISGLIPYIEMTFVDTSGTIFTVPVNFLIIDSQEHFILLGMPTIMFYRMTLNFDTSTVSMKVNNNNGDTNHTVKMIIKEC